MKPLILALALVACVAPAAPAFAAKPPVLAWSKRNSGIMAMMATIK